MIAIGLQINPSSWLQLASAQERKSANFIIVFGQSLNCFVCLKTFGTVKVLQLTDV